MSAVFDPVPIMRPMQPDDVTTVRRIESAAYRFPWSEAIFRDCLRVGYACWVLEDACGVIGYTVLSAGAGEAHVLNLCVAAERRGEGHGRRLLEHLIGLSREYRARQLFLEVRPSNDVAIRLYREMGFREVGRRPGYYPDEGGREDALVLRLRL